MMLSADFSPVSDTQKMAVALSGGADSMALLHFLSAQKKWAIDALIVNHALRPEAASEAAHVAAQVAAWPGVTPYVLVWAGDKPTSRIQEKARAARYALMTAHCHDHGIKALTLAHHRDDQAETFLLRLTKGSGLDGLAGMRPWQVYAGGLHLWRPFLHVSHDDLVAYLQAQGINWVEDPSNQNTAFTRVRLRQARAALEAEGMTNKRLSLSAKRLSRASEALRVLSAQLFEDAVIVRLETRLELDWPRLKAAPLELVIRSLAMAVAAVATPSPYGPRFEKMECLATRFYNTTQPLTATLAGVIVSLDAGLNRITLKREAGKP